MAVLTQLRGGSDRALLPQPGSGRSRLPTATEFNPEIGDRQRPTAGKGKDPSDKSRQDLTDSEVVEEEGR